MCSSRVRAVRTAIGVSYLAGALCWILNACLSGWQPGHNSRVEAYLKGITAVLGAALFHVGAMCQLWESLNTRQPSQLPNSTYEPWLLQTDHSKVSLDASSIDGGSTDSQLQLLQPRALATSAGSTMQQQLGDKYLCTSSLASRPVSDSTLQLLRSSSGSSNAVYHTDVDLQQLQRSRSLAGHSDSGSVLHRSVSAAGRGDSTGCRNDKASSLAGHSDSSEVQMAECSSPSSPPPLDDPPEQQPLLLGAQPSSLQQQTQQVQVQMQQQTRGSGAPGLIGRGQKSLSPLTPAAVAADSPGQQSRNNNTQQAACGSLPAHNTIINSRCRQYQQHQGQQRRLPELDVASPQPASSKSGASSKSPGGNPIATPQPWLPAAVAASISNRSDARGTLLLDAPWVWWEWQPDSLSFMAALLQVTGTTIFVAACVFGFPGVLPINFAAGDWKYWDALFWSPFLVGSCMFIASAALSLRDCQGSWTQPQPNSTAWWMHVANTVGSVGFWLCSFFGFFAYPAQKYQRWGMAFSCLWGSCCFAVAAHLQLLLACS